MLQSSDILIKIIDVLAAILEALFSFVDSVIAGEFTLADDNKTTATE